MNVCVPKEIENREYRVGLTPERDFPKAHHTLFSVLHLAPDAAQTRDLAVSGAICAERVPVVCPDSARYRSAGRFSGRETRHSRDVWFGDRLGRRLDVTACGDVCVQ